MISIRSIVVRYVAVIKAAAALLLIASHGIALAQTSDHCAAIPKAQFADYVKHSASDDWFDVYEVEKNIFAIAEPYQWQEVISYLIVGDKQAVLFDSGNGIANIKAVVDALTSKEIIVINSHGHEDHVGGNYQFTRVMAIANAFTRQKSLGTATNAYLQGEVSAEALCKPLVKPIEHHHIKAFTISDTVANHHKLDIGGRVLELIQMPGHTPDSLVMIDRAAGFMWTGDSYYPGQIWLYEPETDYQAYRQSIAQMAAIAQPLRQLFPAHNVPIAPVQDLTKVRDAYEGIIKGNNDYHSPEPGQIIYEFTGFSFLLSDRILTTRKQLHKN